MENALQAINAALALVRAASQAFDTASALFAKARAEGRDVTDAELAELKAQRDKSLSDFRDQVGG